MIRKLTKAVVLAVAVLFVVTTLAAAAAGMMGTVDSDGRMVKDDKGKMMEGAMAPAGAKAGDKVSCEKGADGKMMCKKM